MTKAKSKSKSNKVSTQLAHNTAQHHETGGILLFVVHLRVETMQHGLSMCRRDAGGDDGERRGK